MKLIHNCTHYRLCVMGCVKWCVCTNVCMCVCVPVEIRMIDVLQNHLPLILCGLVSPAPSTNHSTLVRTTSSGFLKEADTVSVLPTLAGWFTDSVMSGDLKRKVSLSTKTESVSFTVTKALMLTMSWSCTFPMYSEGGRVMGILRVAVGPKGEMTHVT